MKKFLFTLAAMLMAGSMFADNYFYVPTFNVTSDQVGTNITVPVAAHLDDALNAGTIFLTLPEGLVLRRIEMGSDLANLTYYDDWGDEWPADQTVFVGNVNTTSFGFATANKGYYEVDGQWVEYGAVKLMPGDYTEIAKLTIRVTDAFGPAYITVRSELSCGNDARPWVNGNQSWEGVLHTDPVSFNGVMPGGSTEDFVATADVTFNGNVATLSYEANDPDAVVTVTVNGVETEVEWNNGVATYTVVESTVPGDYNVTVELTVAPKEGGTYVGDAVSDADTYSYHVDEPTIPFQATADVTFNGNVATLTYEANDPNAVVTTNVEGVEWNGNVGTYTVVESTVPGDYSVTVELTVAPNPNGLYVGEAVTATDTYTYHVDEPALPTFEGTVSVEFTGNVAAISYDVNDPDAVAKVYVNDVETAVEWDRAHNATYTVVESTVPGDYSVTVKLVVTPSENYDGEAKEASDTYTYHVAEPLTLDAPVINDPVKGAPMYGWILDPNGGVDEQGNPARVWGLLGYQYTISITNPNAEGTLYYSLNGGEPQVYNGAFPVANGTVVTAWVEAMDGDELVKSDEATYTVNIADNATSVNEIANGKAVANVRYFNVAGQEMQEVNGMTIVVTTYTDGTTSAVKVMK